MSGGSNRGSELRFCPYCAAGYEWLDSYPPEGPCPGCRRAEQLERELTQTQHMFAAAIYAQPSRTIKVWPVHLEVDLVVHRRDEPGDHSIEFRADRLDA